MKTTILNLKTMKPQTKKWLTAAAIGASMLLSNTSSAQNVSISPTGNAPDNSAALDIRDYTDKGVLILRLTTAQRNAIPSPALGLTIFNISCKEFQYWDGTQYFL